MTQAEVILFHTSCYRNIIATDLLFFFVSINTSKTSNTFRQFCASSGMSLSPKEEAVLKPMAGRGQGLGPAFQAGFSLWLSLSVKCSGPADRTSSEMCVPFLFSHSQCSWSRSREQTENCSLPTHCGMDCPADCLFRCCWIIIIRPHTIKN